MRHELLEMVPNRDSESPLVRACSELPCTLRGSVFARHSVGTCAAGANTTDFFPDVVVYAGEALHSDIDVGQVVLPSWPKDCAGGAADVSAAAAADIATAAAAKGTADVDGAAVCDLDHRGGAW